MTNKNGDKSERLLDALAHELQTMSDTDALEGEDAEQLVALGERLLKGAREEAGRLRMADAKRKLSGASAPTSIVQRPSADEARRYLASRSKLTLAARGLNELSDADILDLFDQAMSLEASSDGDAKDRKK